ncbi:glycosyltransferase family 2 protein [Solwaraspora sp. WMMD791]|uniref:glycosyltransferase family 2 protein n=1 Tax=Solwaraspora sp. WMMD791 TaxID=3016086 RepID=UPI00249A6794|nr:glycosyltransferase family 2 protein [Solwaraspora sp. WMMD791]WFE27115.1 glycosyltransferase family 2 protein [Solwaraspora sp. WMMD791]
MPTPTVSVVVPTHHPDRLAGLHAAVDSVRRQDPAPDEIIVVVDHHPALADRITRELPDVTVLANAYQRGVSGNRNTGAEHAHGDLVVFCDDDVVAHPGWLAGLVAAFDDPSVIGAGGGIAPAWQQRQPEWFPDEFRWAVGGSYAGQPDRPGPVRNVWSASMAVRRTAFRQAGGFRTGFGKVGDRARPEDTELCLRMSAVTGGRWWYVPQAMISHGVPASHSTFRYFLRRCFAEGRGKIAMAALLDGAPSLGAEQDYLRRTLPRALRREAGAAVRGAGRGRGAARRHAARVGAILAGTAAAAAGALTETAVSARPSTRTTPPTGTTPAGTAATTRPTIGAQR